MLSQPPFKATTSQLAISLYGTNFSSFDVYLELFKLTGGEEATFVTMKDAGYTAYTIGAGMMHLGENRQTVFSNLWAIGFSRSEAMSVSWKLFPFDPEQFMAQVASGL